MAGWPANPIVYELNTWVWLGELSRRYGREISLPTVPEAEWDALGDLGIDAVWLMGVWERSPLGRKVASETPAMVDEFRHVLPDYTDEDNVGSPYCVRSYVVESRLGGPPGLAAARDSLRSRGLRLILDYVPNHVALDHPWVQEHPEYFIRGDDADLSRDSDGFFPVEGNVIARGRDPNFPPWPDVAQLNAFSRDLREAVIETVASIAAQCDGIRCDMAMLMMTDIFRRTWGGRAGESPAAEFWPELIAAVRQRHPDVLFIAEAYWDLEFALQEQGFDYCYDKRLYDRLVHEGADSVRGHLHAGIDYQLRLVRFIENHDEPRAAAVFQPPERERAAATIAATLPGLRLLHQGQFEGKRTRIPVFLRRGPDEPEDAEMTAFYRALLRAIEACGGLGGEWRLCEVRGWPDNESCRSLLAWGWKQDEKTALVVVNYDGRPSQGLVEAGWLIGDGPCRMEDPIAGTLFERDGAGLRETGLYVELGPWGTHFLVVSTVASPVHSGPA